MTSSGNAVEMTTSTGYYTVVAVAAVVVSFDDSCPSLCECRRRRQKALPKLERQTRFRKPDEKNLLKSVMKISVTMKPTIKSLDGVRQKMASSDEMYKSSSVIGRKR